MKCSYCNKENAAKKCSKCHSVHYCDTNCQRKDWEVHKLRCCQTIFTRDVDDELINKYQDVIYNKMANETLPNGFLQTLFSDLSFIQSVYPGLSKDDKNIKWKSYYEFIKDEHIRNKIKVK